MIHLWGLTIGAQAVVVGLLSGLGYAVLGAGLVLVYRATRVINFAYGQIGAFSAAVLVVLVQNDHLPYGVALVAAVGTGGLVGLVIELGVVRRLFTASRLILLVATIGISELLVVAQAELPRVAAGNSFPIPIHRVLSVGSVLLIGADFMIIAAVPAIVLGLGFFLSRTPYGIAIRASADNPDAARLAGISVKRVSTLVWVLAGAIAAITAVLIEPVQGTLANVASPALGPALLLRALAAGLVGRLTNIPMTLLGGLGIGVVEAVLLASFPSQPGLTDVVLLVVILGLLLLRGGGVAAAGEAVSSLAVRVRPIPDRLRAVAWVPWLTRGPAALGLAAALLLPVVFSEPSQLFLLGRVLIFAVIGLSVTVLTGWAGQLSLGQFAFVGIGAMATSALTARGMPFGAAVAYAVVVGVAAALIVGSPALRIKGLFLAVSTLAFAVAASSFFLGLPIFAGGTGGIDVVPGHLGPVNFSAYLPYYYLCLVVLAASVAAVVQLRRSGIGRSLIAARDNEPAAAAVTVSPTVAKLTAFALAGGLAALAGALLAGLTQRFSAADFGPGQSLAVLAMTIVGGMGSVTGALLGAAYVIGVPALLGDSATATALTSGVGLLVLLLYFPGGLVSLLYRARGALLAVAERRLRRSEEPVDPSPPARARLAFAPPRPVDDRAPALAVDGMSVRFGGQVALDKVSLTAGPGEVVGLIGANGAGKSTLMNAISGFVACTGRVWLGGNELTHLSPTERARAGLGRAFQDARLFADLTVTETVMLALESGQRSELVPSMLALPPARRAERAKRARAGDLVDFLGLGRYAGAFISELSTGTRRIVELTCLLALEPAVLLLDEPTSGLAQREAEAFGPLVTAIQAELGAALLIIEHDIPLVMSISDRIYCLGVGRVIAEGDPEAVRQDAAVVASYLGTDARAIARSGATTHAVRAG